MKKKRWEILIMIPIIASLVGCVSETVRTVEVTQVVQETVIVPRVREVVITATPRLPYTPALRACQPDNCVPYFAGAEVIRQYYTFIDQGLYEDAYNLLSQARQDRQSLEDCIIGYEIFFKTVKVITLEPYYSFDPNSEIQYYVQYYHESEKAWEKNIDYSFITTIIEGGAWKIDAFDNLTKH